MTTDLHNKSDTVETTTKYVVVAESGNTIRIISEWRTSVCSFDQAKKNLMHARKSHAHVKLILRTIIDVIIE